MKSSHKRITSCLIAFVMLVSCMFTNIVIAGNTNENASISDDIISSTNVAVHDAVDLGAPISGDAYWSADDLAVAASLTEAPALDDAGIFTYTVMTDGKSAVDINSKTFSDGTEFSQRLKTGGIAKVDTKVGTFTLNAPSAGTLTVYAITSSNSTARTVEVYDATGVQVGDTYITGGWEGIPTQDQLIPLVVEIPAAGEYTIAGTSGAINYYGMSFIAHGWFKPENYDKNAKDVWDFSPTYVTGTNNYITADNINRLFGNYSAGATGVYFDESFIAGNLKYSSEKSPAARLRTINNKVTRYDNDSQLSEITGFDYMVNDITGCLYFNSYSGSSYKYFDIDLDAGDIVKVWLKFDNGDDSLHLYDEEGNQVDGYSDVIDGSTGGTVQTFAVNKSGIYSISSGNAGNPVGIYRITREKGSFTTVSGNVTMPGNMPEFRLVFTNTATGEKTECEVEEGKYSVELLTGYKYSVSMEGAEGYLLSEGFSITAEGESATNDIVIKGRDIAIVSGTIEGLTADEVKEANIKFVPNETRDYVPELTIDGTNYSVRLEKNVNYTVEYSGSKDIELENSRFNVTDNSVTENLRFVPKTRYKVNIESDWCSAEDLANAVFTFTDIEDSSYVYTFTGTDNIALRNGKYSVKVENTGVYKYDSIDDIEVNNSEAVLNIDFYSEWNFDNDDDWTGADFSGVADGEFKGLIFNLDTVKYHSVGATMRNGTISVPVKGMSGILTVGVCYDYNITLPDGRNYSYRTGSISNVDEFKCNVYGSSEYVNIDVGNDKNSYIKYIKFNSYEYEYNADAKIYIVGDSTACYYGPESDTNYYYKRVGFGTGLESYVNGDTEVVNLALSGRSSKSFTAEANYQTLKDNIKDGDFLIIAFGHNDEKADDPTRYTDPLGDKDTEGSFKNSLYVNYVQLAQEKGAIPILCSPIVRRTDNGTWIDNQLHIANGGDYAACVRELAEEINVPFIDLTELTKAKYDELTPANTVKLHAWINSSGISVDNTHLNNYGAKEVGYLIATNAPDVLKPYIIENPVEPTEADLIVNPDYIEPSSDDLTGEALVSKLWKTTAPWYGTVFGDIGGTSRLYATDTEGNIIEDQLAVNTTTGNTNFAITENGDGSVTVRAGEVKTDDKNAAAYSYGKIANTSDGIAMYYRPVDAASNCTIKAKAHVNGVANTNNQVAFGAIIADEILVDEYNRIMIENYVAASPLKMVANVGGTSAGTGELITDTAWGGYARINGTLTQGAEIATADGIPKAGDVIDVEITKVGNIYTVKYGDYESEFGIYMTGTMYVGLFAARCADITFTDIVYNNEVVEGGNTTTETTTEGVTESTTSDIDNLFSNSPNKYKKTAESNNGWNIVNDNGEFYAQSSNTADGSSSAISLTIEGPGVLYYEAAVSSEEYGDYLRTYVNGTKQMPISGSNYNLKNPYVNCIVLNEGENVITWEYSKDSSGSAGQDCAWIKNLRVADIGDSNLDGKVDITDAVLGQKYAADSSAISDVLGQKAADHNNDGTVDKTDTAYVLKEIIKSIA